MEQQKPRGGGGRQCLARRTPLELALAAALAVAVAAAVAVGISFGVERAGPSSCISPMCIHALGGGPVRSGGGIDSATTARCKAQLHAYANKPSGAYWPEVQLAADSAMKAFGFSNTASSSASSATSADGAPAASVSRSLLAGASAQQRQQRQHARRQAPATAAGGAGGGAFLLGGPVAAAALAPASAPTPPTPGKDQVVVFDIDETVLSNMPQILNPEVWSWDAWVAAAQAPALDATLAFYRALCAAGYSVAFVTGRKEASRNATAANLEAAGYGRPCAQGPGPFYGTASAADGGGSGSGCCYAALYLRQPGDTRLASVYKPWARKQLLRAAAAGNAPMKLAALVGDQFSDLNGEDAAPWAFKLPNPFYFIL